MACIAARILQNARPVPILAQASAKGLSAIAVLRLSGSELATWLLPRLGWSLEPRRLSLRILKTADGTAIDQVLAVFFPAPYSFTGEDVLEVHTHGSPALVAWAVEALLGLGEDHQLRLARPGEFSERAFFNDRLDLAQAEAIADLIAASTRLQAKAALRSLQGDFSRQVRAHLEAVQHLRLLVEAALDFPEEPVESLSDWGLDAALSETIKSMRAELPAWQQGAQLQAGLSLALIGPPNAGKSSLLNAFVGEELALVDAEPGTTRDRISKSFQWGGQLIELTDTAGIRDAAQAGRIELKGMQQSWESVSRAQAVLLVISLEDLWDVSGSMAPPAEGKARQHVAAGLGHGGFETVLHAQSLEQQAQSLRRLAQDFARQWWNRHGEESRSGAVQPPTLVVLNKLDLLSTGLEQVALLDHLGGQGTWGSESAVEADCPGDWTVILVSARERIGLERLMKSVLERLQAQGESTEPVWARLRHVKALERAIAHLQLALAHWTASSCQAELMAEELRLAQRALAEIIGVWSDEDLLGAIFSRFCIGK